MISKNLDKIVSIRPWGTILLEDTLLCDGPNKSGMDDGKNIACYTHIHDDHIGGLENALGGAGSRVYATDETKNLSSALLMQDREWINERTNYFGLEYNKTIHDGDLDITLRKAHHILGSAQLLVQKKENSILYSSDFILEGTYTGDKNVKHLILDATHGSHSKKQKFTDVLESKKNLLAKTREIMIEGSKKQLNIHASRGTLQLAMSWIRSIIDDPDIPFLASKKDMNLAHGYTVNGHNCGKIEDVDKKFRNYFDNRHPFIRFISSKNETNCEIVEPVVPSIRIGSSSATSLENDSNMFIVNLKEHSTVEEVEQYVQAISPEHIIIDNSSRTKNPENAPYLKQLFKNKDYDVSLSPKIHPLIRENI